MLKKLFIPLVLVFATASAEAQITVSVGVAPPSAYIATTQPEYFEGRPVYWYNNNWYYRDHGRWSYYRTEPGYLRERRGRWVGHPEYHSRERVVVHERRPEPARYRYRR